MNLRLAGKRALVTGSSSGIGAQIARMLAAEGVRVVVHGRDARRAQAVLREIEAGGGTAAISLGDLTVRSERDEAIERAQRAFGGIDILVNNAGGSDVTAGRSWFETGSEQWMDAFRQNVLPAVLLATALVPGMKRQGWGRCIQISSRNAISAYPEFAPYGAAKAALNNLTLSLSKALAGTGVTSNGIMPGLIYTPLVDPWFAALAREQGSDDQDIGRDFAIKNVLRQTVSRLGQPRDIAFAVCMIASPLCDFMTGTTFRVDGGATPTV